MDENLPAKHEQPSAAKMRLIWATITSTGGNGSSNAKAREELDMGTS
jgi:hypothetical protein